VHLDSDVAVNLQTCLSTFRLWPSNYGPFVLHSIVKGFGNYLSPLLKFRPTNTFHVLLSMLNYCCSCSRSSYWERTAPAWLSVAGMAGYGNTVILQTTL